MTSSSHSGVSCPRLTTSQGNSTSKSPDKNGAFNCLNCPDIICALDRTRPNPKTISAPKIIEVDITCLSCGIIESVEISEGKLCGHHVEHSIISGKWQQKDGHIYHIPCHTIGILLQGMS